jgi:hypothetical protein
MITNLQVMKKRNMSNHFKLRIFSKNCGGKIILVILFNKKY